MPGRRTTRSSAPSSPRKSTATTRPTSSHRDRVATPQLQLPTETPSTDLRKRICSIFADAQATTAGHRKLVINLRKVQGDCCYGTVRKGKGSKKDAERDIAEDEGEGAFNAEIGHCVIRLMGVKRSESVGDRVVRFVGLFLKHASEKDMALLGDLDPNASTIPETPTTRLTTAILHRILPLLTSKDKTTRFRSTQLVSHVINSLDSIDDDVFQLLRSGLLRRIRDKEPAVRVQAVLGLGRLAGNETGAEANSDQDSSDDEGSGRSGLLEKLLDVMQNDPSADVRRSLLLNLPLTPSTLPFLLERARDQDALTRRALYSRLLPALGDFRHLSLSMREKLLRWGLRDRDEGVRKSAIKLFRERWIEDCAATHRPAPESEGGPVGGEQEPNFDGLLELLERIDVVNSGVDNGVALEAMSGFWEGRPDYRRAIQFDELFWEELTAESIFMARSFNQYCRKENMEDLVEEKMPEVTKFAFYLERYARKLVDSLKRIAAAVGTTEQEDEDVEQSLVEQEFIVEQLLHIASTLDYSDEVGRRKTFALMREILAIAELPEEVTRLVIEVLRCLCGDERAGEREFCDVILEAVAEVHDTIMADEEANDGESGTEDSFHSAHSELSTDTVQVDKLKKMKVRGKPRNGPGEDGADADDDSVNDDEEAAAIQAIMINMKCLHIASCMLSNIESNLQSNVHLVTMLNNLVIPAVRSHEAPIRERGLLCLGLCCLLDRALAEENLTLFIHCFAKGHDALQVYALHIISDILTTHGRTLLDSPALVPETTGKSSAQVLFKIFAKALRAEDKPDVQSASCIALCKLMLGGVIQDEDLLKALVVAYFDPSTAANLALRQALSYFLPVYCHSKREHQELMRKISVPAIHALFLIRDEVDEEEEMVGLAVVAAHLVEWTDPRRVVVLGSGGPAGDSLVDDAGKLKVLPQVVGDVHLDLATDVLEKILSSGCNKDERKPLASMLSKLYVTSNADPEKLRTVQELVTEAVDDRVLSDAPSRNALIKLQSSLAKVIVEEAAAPEAEADEPEATVPGDETGQGDEGETALSVELRSELVLRPKAAEPVSHRESVSLSETVIDDDTDDTVS